MLVDGTWDKLFFGFHTNVRPTAHQSSQGSNKSDRWCLILARWSYYCFSLGQRQKLGPCNQTLGPEHLLEIWTERLSVTHTAEVDMFLNTCCFVSYLIWIYDCTSVASVSGRETKEREKNEDRKMDWERGEEWDRGKEGRNLPVGDTLAINHKFQPVYTGGQSASLFWSLCPQLPGSALNGCLSWTTSKRHKLKCLCV